MITMRDLREFMETIGRMTAEDLHGVLRAQRAQPYPENEVYAELTQRELLERERQ